jgi:alkanesulfonate monooxygenase SsuD/methylene tetrahydromethanopterin reductase-like flavin-dependent oxidoreductase (luciferase family)
MAGRGSFIESFPLFGYSLDDYDELFAEKLELLLALRESEHVTWPGGRHTHAIDNLGVYPRPLQNPLPVWIAVGGAPASAVRAGALGIPMALAIIGGEPARFAPFRELHKRAAVEAGHAESPAFSINSHGFIADTSQQALDESYPVVSGMMNRRDAARRELRRQPAAGHRKDPFPARDLSSRSVSRSVQRRRTATRQDDAVYRTVRFRSRSRRS